MGTPAFTHQETHAILTGRQGSVPLGTGRCSIWEQVSVPLGTQDLLACEATGRCSICEQGRVPLGTGRCSMRGIGHVFHWEQGGVPFGNMAVFHWDTGLCCIMGIQGVVHIQEHFGGPLGYQGGVPNRNRAVFHWEQGSVPFGNRVCGCTLGNRAVFHLGTGRCSIEEQGECFIWEQGGVPTVNRAVFHLGTLAVFPFTISTLFSSGNRAVFHLGTGRCSIWEH